MNSPLVTQVNDIATHGGLKLPFVTYGKFIIPSTFGFATRGSNYTIHTPPPEGIRGLYTREVTDQERVIVARVQ